jgi:hypothetical protein
MKADLRISIKDFRRVKNLPVELRRRLHTVRQFLNGS